MALGIPAVCVRGRDGEHCKAGEVVLGVNPTGREPVWATTGIPCPFCRGELRRLENARDVRMARIVIECAGGPRCNGRAVVMPATTAALRCKPCALWLFTNAEG